MTGEKEKNVEEKKVRKREKRREKKDGPKMLLAEILKIS